MSLDFRRDTFVAARNYYDMFDTVDMAVRRIVVAGTVAVRRVVAGVGTARRAVHRIAVEIGYRADHRVVEIARQVAAVAVTHRVAAAGTPPWVVHWVAAVATGIVCMATAETFAACMVARPVFET